MLATDRKIKVNTLEDLKKEMKDKNMKDLREVYNRYIRNIHGKNEIIVPTQNWKYVFYQEISEYKEETYTGDIEKYKLYSTTDPILELKMLYFEPAGKSSRIYTERFLRQERKKYQC